VVDEGKSMKHLGNATDRTKLKYLDKNLSQCHTNTNPTCTGLGSNPGLCSNRPATSSPKHGTLHHFTIKLLRITPYILVHVPTIIRLNYMPPTRVSGWDSGDKEELFVYGSFSNAGNIMCQVTGWSITMYKLKKTHLCEGTERNHRKPQLISIAGRHQSVTVTPQIYITDNT